VSTSLFKKKAACSFEAAFTQVTALLYVSKLFVFFL